MKKLLLCVLGLGLPLLAGAAEYVIDSSHTYPNFTISHLGFSMQHGRFNDTGGTLVYDPEAGTGSVEIVIRTDSIDTGHAERDEHLRNADFFNVEEYPEMTFTSTSASFDGEGKGTVEGELTLMGVTQPMTLSVDSIVCGEHPFNQKRVCGFNASGSLKRSDFGMDYGIPMIGDEVTLMLQVEAIHKDDA